MRSMPRIRTRTGWVRAFICWGDGVIEVRSTRHRTTAKRSLQTVVCDPTRRRDASGAPGTVTRVLVPSVVLSAVLLASSAAAPPVPPAQRALDRMSLRQQVGQLFMVGTPATEVDGRTRSQIGRFHVGNVMLTRRSYDGVRQPALVTRTMQAEVSERATAGVRLFVATDQEGGVIRVLQGPGFSDIPSALEQGQRPP